MQTINLHRKTFFKVGMDVYPPNVKYCHEKKIYDGCIVADINHLPFRRKSFDVILCVHVIEHLAKEDGLRVVRNLEEIACTQLIISTHVGFSKQPHAINGNIFEIHRSGYSPNDFRRLQYKVRGEYPSFPGSYFISFVLPLIILVYFSPDRASSMICTKNID